MSGGPQQRIDRVMANPTLIRRGLFMTRFITLRRLFGLGTIQFGIAGICVANAYLSTDEDYEDLVAHSYCVKHAKDVSWLSTVAGAATGSKVGVADGAAGAQNRKVLEPYEEKCIAAVTSLLSFDMRPYVLKSFHQCVELDDPVLALRGKPEFADAWKFLGFWFLKSTPIVQEVRRPLPTYTAAAKSSKNGEVNKNAGTNLSFAAKAQSELILKYQNEATVGWGPVSYSYTFNSSARIFLLNQKIVKMEHRWWHGPLQCAKPENPGDANLFWEYSRRANGFALSLMMIPASPGWVTKQTTAASEAVSAAFAKSENEKADKGKA